MFRNQGSFQKVPPIHRSGKHPATFHFQNRTDPTHAKEAYSKAVGTGIGKGCELHQIEILKDNLGKPILYFNGELVNGFISITHTKQVAAAQVVLMK